MVQADRLRAAMVEHLVASGIVSPGWRKAFERVPRHVLVPRYNDWSSAAGACLEPIQVDETTDPERWLTAVYDPSRTLALAHDDHGFGTVTATMPAIVAEHLEELQVEDGYRVLEVGTGSGYTTALLCERLGSELITSMDVEEEAIRLARARLALVGYRPALVAGDGYQGHPARAPYDRLLAEVQVARIPPSWLAQMRAGGRIVAVMPRNLARLDMQADGSARGRFHPDGFSFIRLRGHEPAWAAQEELLAALSQTKEVRATHIDLAGLLGADGLPGWRDWWDMVRLIELPFELGWVSQDGTETALIDLRDRSWVRLSRERSQVAQGGPRRIWDRVEAFHDRLADLRWPAKERFGLTVCPDGSQCVWLDGPDSEHRWPLAPM